MGKTIRLIREDLNIRVWHAPERISSAIERGGLTDTVRAGRATAHVRPDLPVPRDVPIACRGARFQQFELLQDRTAAADSHERFCRRMAKDFRQSYARRPKFRSSW